MDPETRPAIACDERLAATRAIYVQAALEADRGTALNVVLHALRDGASAVDLYVDVLQAALYEVGRLWEANRITVAHEHAATAITQLVAAHLYERLERQTLRARGRLLITGLEGELHSIGALMVADVLESGGWTVYFLGTDLPHDSVLDAVRRFEPDWVGISATMLSNIQAARRLIDDVRRERAGATRVIVGGAAFRHTPDLWRELGADAHAQDVRDAVRVMCP